MMRYFEGGVDLPNLIYNQARFRDAKNSETPEKF